MVLVLMAYVTHLISKLFRRNDPNKEYLLELVRACTVQGDLTHIRFETYEDGIVVNNISLNDCIRKVVDNFKNTNEFFICENDVYTFVYLDKDYYLKTVTSECNLKDYQIIVPVEDSL